MGHDLAEPDRKARFPGIGLLSAANPTRVMCRAELSLSAVLLRVADVSELRRLVLQGTGLPTSVPHPSLGAAVELACSAYFWHSLSPAAFERFKTWAFAEPLLAETWAALEGTRPMGPEYSAIERDVRTVTDVTAQGLFGNRFRASLVEIGTYSNEFANGLGGALEEMVDNVLQHSTGRRGCGASAVMAYEVGVRSFSFSVGDVGRGVLTSLRENPRWRTLRDDQAALDAVLVHHASSRGSDPGTGFRLVVRTLADLGTFRYRTGDAYVTVETDVVAHRRTTVMGVSAQLSGVQLVVASTGV